MPLRLRGRLPARESGPQVNGDKSQRQAGNRSFEYETQGLGGFAHGIGGKGLTWDKSFPILSANSLFRMARFG